MCGLQVLRQAFLLPFGVKALAATATSQGITSKMVLMGTFSDQVTVPLQIRTISNNSHTA
jgi:hypothetical protein